MRNRALLLGVTASLTLCIASAKADALDFAFTGAFAANFSLSTPGTPDSYVDGALVAYDSVPGVVDNISLTFNSIEFVNTSTLDMIINFYEPTIYYQFQINGPLIYSGPESDPTFAPGDFTGLTAGGASPIPFDGRLETLTISDVSAAPEPTSWALITSGMALLGGALRYGRRRRNGVPDASGHLE